MFINIRRDEENSEHPYHLSGLVIVKIMTVSLENVKYGILDVTPIPLLLSDPLLKRVIDKS